MSDYYEKDIDNIEKGIVYQDINKKKYICGEIIKGNQEGKWIEWYEEGNRIE